MFYVCFYTQKLIQCDHSFEDVMFLLNTFSEEINEHTAAKNKILFIKCLLLVSKFFSIKQSESEVELGNKTSSNF